MPPVIYVPSRIGEGYFTDFQSPSSGATDNGKIWAWNSATSKFEPISIPSTSPGGSTGYVQYNNGSGFAGHSGFVYNGAGVVTLSTAIVSPDIRPASNAVNSTGFSDASGTRVFSVDTTSSRVGIGTTTPATALDVAGWAQFALGASQKLLIGAYYPGGILGINSTSDYDWSLARNSTEVFRFFSSKTTISGGNAERTLTITNGGKVGIGTTSPTAWLHLPASTTSYASLRVPSGVAPTSPNGGDLWYDGANLKFRDGATTRTLTWT